MNCNVIQDLIPLYVDGCCSEESEKAVEEHLKKCDTCQKLVDDMKAPAEVTETAKAPKTFRKLNDWKASILQSVLLFFSFALITVGVALEAATPSGFFNGLWAVNLVIPATGFMLSLANWYFLRVYKSRKAFSTCSMLATLGITLAAYVWSGFHYGLDIFSLFAKNSFADALEMLQALLSLGGIGILLTAVFCLLSKLLSHQFAKMMGKE